MSNKIMLPLESFIHFEKSTPNALLFRQPLDGKWHETTWGEAGQEVRKLAQSIMDLNLPPKSKIALLSKNCAHWIMTDLAIWMAGHISVPIYPTLTSDSIQEILTHSESKLLFAGKLDEWDKQKTNLNTDIPWIHFPHWKNTDCQSWDDFTKGKSPYQGTIETKNDDLCTIIYTSGTTGTPKGVMHTFETFACPIVTAKESLKLTSEERFFSYLPLAHVAERLIIEVATIYTGGQISFAESLDTFAKNLTESRPTVFMAVPRIWTKFQMGILAKMPQNKLNILLKVPIINALIKKKIKAALGLDACRIAVSGAAPISTDLLQWWQKLGIQIHEAYGMTENFCYGTFNLPEKTKFGTVGQSWPDSETKIGENGEILLRSKANMIGYYKNPELTKEVLDEQGWIHTGDQGEIDSNGYLKITGRVKELFKTAKGKYIAPSPIEKLFTKSPFVEQVCVMGSGYPQPMAIVVLSEGGQKENKESIQANMQTLLEQINDEVENYERLNHIVVSHDEWSTENGILTPTLKIKRNAIEKKYNPKLDDWYNQAHKIIWE
ncbi:MAG: AMP-binding protein [Bdellovibrionales bacterium]|jgi:long-chain acyl-CoA synthetase|nr:AMP-binding protein [Bdellovibrionales bacterium]